MNKVTISDDVVRIEIAGWDRIWSFKGSLSIPKASIDKVYRHDGKLTPPWCRCPGTALPRVIIAGTYCGRGRKEFWNTHFSQETLVFDLKGAGYTRIVLDVDDPERIIAELAIGQLDSQPDNQGIQPPTLATQKKGTGRSRMLLWMAILLGLCFGGFMIDGFIRLFQLTSIGEVMTPKQAFEWLGCQPVPASVRNIETSGGFSGLSDASIIVESRIAPDDFYFLVKQGGFVPEDGSRLEDRQKNRHFPDSEFYRKDKGEFKKDNELAEVRLEASKEHDRIIIFYIHI